jgi:peptide/nickel transport system ATP-binding protein
MSDQQTVSVATSAEPLLQVKNLRMWFPIKRGLLRRTVGHVRAVDGVSFAIEAGKTMALVGESGCGKTTVGRALLRLLEPQEGSVLYGGRDLLRLPNHELRMVRRELQMVFQDPTTALDPRMRVRDILTEGMESFGIGATAEERTQKAKELLERVKLDARHIQRYPHEFSGGQRQRLGIARALSVDPKLIILDEAVSALDVSIQAQILNLLSDLQKELGLAFLFITHDLSVVRYLADDVSVMYLGQVVEQGKTRDVFETPQHPYTQGLLASIPSVDPERRSLEVRVLGDVPSSSQPPNGCRFHTRCPKVFARCSLEAPQLYSVAQGVARCFLHAQSESTGPQPSVPTSVA